VRLKLLNNLELIRPSQEGPFFYLQIALLILAPSSDKEKNLVLADKRNPNLRTSQGHLKFQYHYRKAVWIISCPNMNKKKRPLKGALLKRIFKLDFSET